jgi:hypothetical protein
MKFEDSAQISGVCCVLRVVISPKISFDLLASSDRNWSPGKEAFLNRGLM